MNHTQTRIEVKRLTPISQNGYLQQLAAKVWQTQHANPNPFGHIFTTDKHYPKRRSSHITAHPIPTE